MKTQAISSQTKVTKTLRSNPSNYTVKDFNELWRTNAEFRRYAGQVYHYLDTMREGRVLSLLRVPDNKIEWLMITAVAFLEEGVHWLSYTFNDDYTQIHHTHVDNWEIQIAIKEKYEKDNT